MKLDAIKALGAKGSAAKKKPAETAAAPAPAADKPAAKPAAKKDPKPAADVSSAPANDSPKKPAKAAVQAAKAVEKLKDTLPATAASPARAGTEDGAAAAGALSSRSGSERPAESAEDVEDTAREYVEAAADWFRTQFGIDGPRRDGREAEVVVDEDVEGAWARTEGDDDPGRVEFGVENGKWLINPLIAAHEYAHLVSFALQEEHGGGDAYLARLESDIQYLEAVHARALEDGVRERNPEAYAAIRSRLDSARWRLDEVNISDVDKLAGHEHNDSAVSEGLADIFAATMNRTWHMDTNGTSDRDARTGENLVSHRNEPSFDSHEYAGVLTTAAADIQAELGWDETSQLFAAAIQNDTFNSASGFNQIARMVYYEAQARYGDEAAAQVRAAFRERGVEITENYATVLGMDPEYAARIDGSIG